MHLIRGAVLVELARLDEAEAAIEQGLPLVHTSSVTLEAAGRRSARATFGAGGAVEQLELLHFASNAVREVGEVISSTASVPSVAIRLLESSTIAEEARSAAILGLLDQGLALVDLRRVHEIELCLRPRRSIGIWAVRGEACEQREGAALTVLSAPAPGRLERMRATVSRAVLRARPPPVALRPIDVSTTSEIVDPLMIGISIDTGRRAAGERHRDRRGGDRRRACTRHRRRLPRLYFPGDDRRSG